MTCANIQERLHADQEQAQSDPAVCTHLEQCDDCRQVADELSAISSALKATPLPSLPEGFELTLRRRLRDEATQSAPTAQRIESPMSKAGASRMRVVALAAAITLAVIGGGLLVRVIKQTPQTQVAPTYRKLVLSVRSDKAHDAQFRLKLPEGTKLAGKLAALYGDSTAAFRARLKPGKNEIAVPLVSRGQAPNARIEAELVVGGQRLRETIRLTAGPTNSQPNAIKVAWLVREGVEVL
jgi:hypothetical protein